MKARRCKCCGGSDDGNPMLPLIAGYCPYCDHWCQRGQARTENCKNHGRENPFTDFNLAHLWPPAGAFSVMKLTIEPSGKTVEINGEQAPLWFGTAANGHRVALVITGLLAQMGEGDTATTQLLKTVPLHGLQAAAGPPTQLLDLLSESTTSTSDVTAPNYQGRIVLTAPPASARPVATTPTPSPRPTPAAAPVVRRKPAKRPAQRVATPAAAPAQPSPPRQHSAPKAQGPARALAPTPVATAAPPADTGPINEALLGRLTKAVALLDGRGPRRGDAHDKQQARQLLALHRDKLHLVEGASKYAGQQSDEAENLLD